MKQNSVEDQKPFMQQEDFEMPNAQPTTGLTNQEESQLEGSTENPKRKVTDMYVYPKEVKRVDIVERLMEQRTNEIKQDAINYLSDPATIKGVNEQVEQEIRLMLETAPLIIGFDLCDFDYFKNPFIKLLYNSNIDYNQDYFMHAETKLNHIPLHTMIRHVKKVMVIKILHRYIDQLSGEFSDVKNKKKLIKKLSEEIFNISKPLTYYDNDYLPSRNKIDLDDRYFEVEYSDELKQVIKDICLDIDSILAPSKIEDEEDEEDGQIAIEDIQNILNS